MNTNLIASLLFASLTTSLSAQAPRLEASMREDVLAARVHNAPVGSFVVLAIAVEEAAIKLPGGQILGVDPIELRGVVVADGAGLAEFAVMMHDPRGRGTAFCVQAVAIDPQRSLDAPGGITVSAVRHLELPATR